MLKSCSRDLRVCRHKKWPCGYSMCSILTKGRSLSPSVNRRLLEPFSDKSLGILMRLRFKRKKQGQLLLS